MIPFELSDEQKQIQETARRFTEKEVAPIAIEMDEKNEFPRHIFKKMGEVGFTGMLLPKEYGGTGLNYVTFCLVFQELNKAQGGMTTCIVPHTGLQLMVNEFGTEEQKRRIIPLLARGEELGSLAITEPDAGSDIGAVRTTAVLNREHYILNGNKRFITNAGEAEQYLVIARTDTDVKGYKGLSALIVAKGLPGFSFGTRENKMGCRALIQGSPIFEDCRVPKENLLGEEGQGMKIAMTVLNYARVTAAISAVALAGTALKNAVKYAKTRVQFGRPIAEFQAIQFMLADMAIQVETAENMLYSVCNLIDNGRGNPAMVGMLKVFATDMAMQVTTDAVQILGGYGYMKEYRVEGYMRDAKLLQIADGTNQIQRRAIANYLLSGD